jgi:hypothetical protein
MALISAWVIRRIMASGRVTVAGLAPASSAARYRPSFRSHSAILLVVSARSKDWGPFLSPLL